MVFENILLVNLWNMNFIYLISTNLYNSVVFELKSYEKISNLFCTVVTINNENKSFFLSNNPFYNIKMILNRFTFQKNKISSLFGKFKCLLKIIIKSRIFFCNIKNATTLLKCFNTVFWRNLMKSTLLQFAQF